MKEWREVNIRLFNLSVSQYLILVSIILSSILFLNVPLVNSFGYEFSVIYSIIFFILSGFLNFNSAEKSSYKKIFIFSVLLIISPIIVVLIYGIFNELCSLTYGISFYIIISVVSYFLGILLSEIIIRLTNRRRKLLFFLIVLLLCLIPVAEIYFNPQIYFYSTLIGFFPGTIYDEKLKIDVGIIAFRLLNLFYFSFVLFYLTKTRNKRNTILLSIIIFIVFLVMNPFLGFSTTHDKLDSVLKNKVETENFTIIFNKAEEKEIKNYIILHEYYYYVLSEKMKLQEKSKIVSYIFDDKKQKKIYFGSEQADVAKPWLKEIYLSKDSWESTLKHELAHVFSSQFGTGIFKLAASFNPALIEGFAEAIDEQYDEIDLHTLSASALKFGYTINVTELFKGLNFFKSYSGLSYLLAGSFCKYLIENYGFESFKVFYSTNDSQIAFNRTIEDLENDYLKFLSTREKLLTKNQIDFYFGRQSIFGKICPRQISVLLEDAFRLVSENKFKQAKKLYDQILHKTNNYSALVGLIRIHSFEKNYSEGIKLINKFLSQFKGTSYYFNLKLIEADLYSMKGELNKSTELYKFIIENNPNIRLKLISQLRIDLINEKLINDYLTGSDPVKFEILKKLNEEKCNFNTILPLINLNENIGLTPDNFLNILRKSLSPGNNEQAYVVFKLSQYLLSKSDFTNARKLAALAMRQSVGSIYYIAIKEHFSKCNWINKNIDEKLNKTVYELFE